MTTKKKKFKHVANMPEPVGEINTMPKETVPDQSLTVRQILSKYANGTIGNISKEPVYSGDLPDLRFLDITEIQNLQRENHEQIKELQNAKKDLELRKAELQRERMFRKEEQFSDAKIVDNVEPKHD